MDFFFTFLFLNSRSIVVKACMRFHWFYLKGFLLPSLLVASVSSSDIEEVFICGVSVFGVCVLLSPLEILVEELSSPINASSFSSSSSIPSLSSSPFFLFRSHCIIFRSIFVFLQQILLLRSNNHGIHIIRIRQLIRPILRKQSLVT